MTNWLRITEMQLPVKRLSNICDGIVIKTTYTLKKNNESGTKRAIDGWRKHWSQQKTNEKEIWESCIRYIKRKEWKKNNQPPYELKRSTLLFEYFIYIKHPCSKYELPFCIQKIFYHDCENVDNDSIERERE